MRLFVAEKPSVAKDLAKVLKANKRCSGYYEGENTIVTWCFGHLVSLCEPAQINPAWKQWKIEDLPLIPHNWPLRTIENSSQQFDIVKELLLAQRVFDVVCATDAGREGELIFRLVYEKAGCKKPIKRLWLSSLTPEAISESLLSLADGREFENLYASALARAKADWLVGMNMSRIYSLTYKGYYTLGRVQTPTLAMVVERDKEIAEFVPESYCELEGVFALLPDQSKVRGFCVKELTVGKKTLASRFEKVRFPPNESTSQALAEECKGKVAKVIEIEERQQKEKPPLLPDLTDLQKQAHRYFGFTAKKTLDLAQRLYEVHKVITYPRSDCPFLSAAVAKGASAIAIAVKSEYSALLEGFDFNKTLIKPYVDDKKITDHHAIIPTGRRGQKLTEDEAKIFDLLCRRFLMLWGPLHVSAHTAVLLEVVCDNDLPVKFLVKGMKEVQRGFKVLQYGAKRRTDEEQSLPVSLHEGQKASTEQTQVLKKETKPKPYLSDASLLSGMESAGLSIEDKKLKRYLSARGLGTAATRASIIENLCQKQYVERIGKTLQATEAGRELIAVVLPEMKSPELTAKWEMELCAIESGNAKAAHFLNKLEKLLTEWTTEIKGKDGAITRINEALRLDASDLQKERHLENYQVSSNSCQEKPNFADIFTTLARFGFTAFRPLQEEVCKTVFSGENALVVMPTGAGKSLCYQIPGIARHGVCLVICPLIALMNDQVNRLNTLGFKAKCIHSGIDRLEARNICKQYLASSIDFLYIAPERLNVPGFLELLAKKAPSLIAVDEAHCISHWGHDFRADYRKLGERLKIFTSVPIIALTATATRKVQKDIVEQLQLTNYKQFISGFRRENLAIEVVSCEVGKRLQVISRFLKNQEFLPAIIYAPTRKEAESIAKQLKSEFRVEAYHAGMEPLKRECVQEQFMSEKVDIIVATVAFGMGIDKRNIRSVIHTASPSTLSGYYQEIGRGGRDGKFCKVILLSDHSDQRILHYLHDLNYPDIKLLEKIMREVPDEGISQGELNITYEPDLLDMLLQKLWVHGAIEYDNYGSIKKTAKDWKRSYAQQKQQKLYQIDEMMEYIHKDDICRMVQLTLHFGEKLAKGEPGCGLCDVCAPLQTMVKTRVDLCESEKRIVKLVEQALLEKSIWSLGALHKKICEMQNIAKGTFDQLLLALQSKKRLTIGTAEFSKNGRNISYQQVTKAPGWKKQMSIEEVLDLKIWRLRIDESLEIKLSVSKKRSSALQTNLSLADPNYNKVVGALRDWRLKKAQFHKMPAFIVLQNSSLYELASVVPQSLQELEMISGFGAKKIKQFGAEILEVLKEASAGFGV